MLASAYHNGKAIIVHMSIVDAKGHKLRTDAAIAFVGMRSEAEKTAGVHLVINSAFRTMEEQNKLYREYKDGKRKSVVAKPGYSNHQSGTAVDIETDGGKNKAYHWLVANAARHGYYNTVKSEPWHWEWVGEGTSRSS